MARPRTHNAPELSSLLLPPTALMLAVEQAVLRNNLTSVVAASLPEQIAAKLAGIITLDLLHPGERLLEQDISAVLRVSRAPVREALRILERDRLIEFQPRRGALVTELDAEELRDTFFVRSMLFSVLLEGIMRNRPTDLEVLFEKHLPNIRSAAKNTVDDYAVSTFLLNLEIADLATNRLLVDLLKSVSLRTLRYARLGFNATPEAMPKRVKTWEQLEQAVKDRDVPRVLEVATGRISEIRDDSVNAFETRVAQGVETPTGRAASGSS